MRYYCTTYSSTGALLHIQHTTMLVVEERRVGHVDGGPGDGAFWPKSVVSGWQCSYQSDPFSQMDEEDRGEIGEMWKIFLRGCIYPRKRRVITCYRPFLMLVQASRPKMKVRCSCCFSHCPAKPLYSALSLATSSVTQLETAGHLA